MVLGVDLRDDLAKEQEQEGDEDHPDDKACNEICRKIPMLTHKSCTGDRNPCANRIITD